MVTLITDLSPLGGNEEDEELQLSPLRSRLTLLLAPARWDKAHTASGVWGLACHGLELSHQEGGSCRAQPELCWRKQGWDTRNISCPGVGQSEGFPSLGMGKALWAQSVIGISLVLGAGAWT